MKLQARTNLNYIIFSGIIYVVVAGIFYLAVEYVIYEEVDRRLLVEKRDFEHFIQKNRRFETGSYFVEDKIDLHPSALKSPPTFRDTLLLDRYDSIPVPFRQVSFDVAIENGLYRVNIRKSLIESNQLLKIITLVMLLVLSGGLYLLYIFQQRTSRKLWQPFYETLLRAKHFNVHQGEKLTLPRQVIYEFDELNISLNKMTDKILSDYQSLREFTENASHEIQTPLALINSRVEELIQDDGIGGKHIQWIQDIHESAMRLSRLNQALLLLAKIENGQFHDAVKVDLREVLEKQLNAMEEVFALKAIRITSEVEGSFIVKMHGSLADILVGNILGNAVKHNLGENGTISIQLSENQLTVSNSGPPLTVQPEKLFGRFQKQNKATSSLGLGLAIVKKICDFSNLKIGYLYSDGLHVISITTPPK
ncbi:MAG TPA: HAMP domain-containing sensor histidine kinase [Cyclobacteriaceae bacterium]|nr:HAMP domain-containing sensor histidine kinase [Cyclobacteriaceae bacterium]